MEELHVKDEGRLKQLLRQYFEVTIKDDLTLFGMDSQ